MKLRFISEAALNEVSLTQRISQAINQRGREYDNAKAALEAVKKQGELLQQALTAGKKTCKVILKGSKIDVTDSHGSLCAIKIEPGKDGKPVWSYRACGAEWGSAEKSAFDADAVDADAIATLLVELVPSIKSGKVNVSEEYLTEGPVGNLFGKLASAIAKSGEKKAQQIKAGGDMGKLVADVKPLLAEVVQKVNSMTPGVEAVFSSNTNGAFVEVTADYAFEIDASESKAPTLSSAIKGQKVTCKSIEEAVNAVAAAFKVTVKQPETKKSEEVEIETGENTLPAEQQKVLDTLKEMGVDLSKVDMNALLQKLKSE